MLHFYKFLHSESKITVAAFNYGTCFQKALPVFTATKQHLPCSAPQQCCPASTANKTTFYMKQEAGQT